MLWIAVHPNALIGDRLKLTIFAITNRAAEEVDHGNDERFAP